MNVSHASPGLDMLVCPQTKRPLAACTLAEGTRRLDANRLTARRFGSPPPVGPTDTLLVRDDGRCAYPVVDGVPVLMAPEKLVPAGVNCEADLADPRYVEAYREMAFYDRIAAKEAESIETSEAYAAVRPVLAASDADRASFPHPFGVWLDAVYDCAAQWDAYRHVAPVRGRRVMQLGGKGIHAVKLLLAGAAESWLLTPMLGEARCGMALARAAGVAERMRCVVGVAEELPFASGTFDVVYSGGCVHHFAIELALPEAARVLRPGGRFAAIDPWRAPLYNVGVRLFSKREAVDCRPLTRKRVEPFRHAFDRAAVVHHGALTRYPLIGLAKLGWPSSLTAVWRANRVDDVLCSIVPGLRRLGSSVALLGAKEARAGGEVQGGSTPWSA